MNDLDSIVQLMDALQPWRENLVIVGGWAHRLHRFLPRVNIPAYEPLRTRDADVAFSATAALEGDIAVALKAAGFEKELIGDHKPPVTLFRLGHEDDGFYTEFLAPLTGSGLRRDGSVDATITKAGVTAQKLRYLELLLMEPSAVELSPAKGIPTQEPLFVKVANPVTFISQKLLIRTDRAPAKQAQDTLYVHDTLELFSGELDAMKGVWNDRLRPQIPARTVKKIEELSRSQFAHTTDAIRSAALVAAGRRLTAENVRAACEYGLSEIFA
jgi:hypothetical protein